MYHDKFFKDFIPVEEMVKLSDYGTSFAAMKAQDLIEAFWETHVPKNRTWDTIRIYSLLFEAGRIQGIREERAKKRGDF